MTAVLWLIILVTVAAYRWRRPLRQQIEIESAAVMAWYDELPPVRDHEKTAVGRHRAAA